MEIYGLRCRCHPEDGVRYVGRTIRTVAKRFKGHRAGARSESAYPVYAWMRKHGVENVYPEILAVASSHEELARLELEWIEKLLPSGRLLNLIVVEQGVWVATAEYRANMSAAHRGKVLSEEHRAKIGAAGKGRKHSDEARAKMSASQRGRVLSVETRAKLSVAAKGRVYSDEARAKFSEAHKRRIDRATEVT